MSESKGMLSESTNKIRKLALYFFIFIVLLINYGCAHMDTDKYLQHGDYEKARKTIHKSSRNDLYTKSENLVRTCLIYSKLKQYNNIFMCLEQLEQNISNGDKIISSGLFNTSNILPSDITAVPSLMKSVAFLETGNYQKAIASAKKAYHLSALMSAGDKINNWDKRLKIRSLSILVMANAFNGNRQQALKHLKGLESQSIGYFSGYVVNKEKKYALSKAYMSLGMYEKVLTSFSFGDLASYFADLYTLGIFRTDMVKDQAFGYLELPQEFVNYKALFETGKIEEAKKGYDRLLQNSATSTNGEIYWAILYDRGRIAEIEKKYHEAINFYRRAIDVIETQRSTINTEASKIGFVGNKQDVYSHIIFALAASEKPKEAFEYAERAKSRALVDQLASISKFKLFGHGQKSSKFISDLTQNEIDLNSYDLTLDKNKIGQRGIQIRKKLQEKYPGIASLVTVEGVTSDEIAGYLRGNETLLEFYYSKNRLIAFVLNHEMARSFELRGENIDDLSSAFRKSILNPKTKEYLAISEKLYNMLIMPVEEYLTTPTVIIVPHGILHYLPFNALNDGEKYLVDKYNLVFLPSAGVLRYLSEKKKTNDDSILVFGNPDLGDPRYNLKYAEQEAKSIAALFDNSTLFIEEKAREGIVKKIGDQFGFIHFATHGIFEPDSPLDSALYLSKDGNNDGRLTVRELYTLHLNANLVTLSACETGLGRIKPGDDLIGLQRGFLYAGADSIIASLWNVDDASTSELMVDFYKNLKIHSKSVALRQAQLVVKKNYDHPYYWAAFQLTGLAE